MWPVLRGACSGDFGIGYFGQSHLTAAYILRRQFGAKWTCFLCNLIAPGSPAAQHDISGSAPSIAREDTVTFAPIDSFRTRVFLEPLGVLLVAEGCMISEITMDMTACTVNVTVAPQSMLSTKWRLVLQHVAPVVRPAGASLQVVCSSQQASTSGRHGSIDVGHGQMLYTHGGRQVGTHMLVNLVMGWKQWFCRAHMRLQQAARGWGIASRKLLDACARTCRGMPQLLEIRDKEDRTVKPAQSNVHNAGSNATMCSMMCQHVEGSPTHLTGWELSCANVPPVPQAHVLLHW